MPLLAVDTPEVELLKYMAQNLLVKPPLRSMPLLSLKKQVVQLLLLTLSMHWIRYMLVVLVLMSTHCLCLNLILARWH